MTFLAHANIYFLYTICIAYILLVLIYHILNIYCFLLIYNFYIPTSW